MKQRIKIVKFLKVLENGAESHLYATVSQDVEPIKKGDWHIVFNVDEKEIDIRNTNKFLSTLDKKIIATTDPKIYADYSTPGTTFVPQLQQQFIKEFVANPKGEFEVEYEDISYYQEDTHPTQDNGRWVEKFKLKLNQDNTVNITSVEEKMYSKEEMYLSAANVVHQISANIGNSDWNMHTTAKMIVDNWIKENL